MGSYLQRHVATPSCQYTDGFGRSGQYLFCHWITESDKAAAGHWTEVSQIPLFPVSPPMPKASLVII